MVSTGNTELPSDLLALLTIREEHAARRAFDSLGSPCKGCDSPTGTNVSFAVDADMPNTGEQSHVSWSTYQTARLKHVVV
jgi:hypothetical protein